MARPLSDSPSQSPISHHLFAGLIGLFLSLGLLKWGTPVVLDYKVVTPQNTSEVIHQVWPLRWGYWCLAFVAIASLFVAKWELVRPRWPLLLMSIWLVWQFVSAGATVDRTLSGETVWHFTAAVICFGIGYFALSQIADLRLMQIGLLLGYIVMLRVGLEQHFGGLENTRWYFYTYILPTLPEPPLDYIRKISTNRIFSTLFYPNSFAGALLLFLPIAAYSGWRIAARFGRMPQLAMVSVIIVASLASLYWSGSKSGWLIMLALGLVTLLHTNLSKRLKIAVISAVLLVGAAGFAVKYAGFFERGATSVVARFDYWRAALQIFRENPVMGSGPGTFSKEYAKIKSPESEMARLTHNDYLEQACDSGLIGFLAFAGFIFGSLIFLYRNRVPKTISWEFLVWLGLLGVCLQAFSEFNFYIPALAWPVFLFIGWLLAKEVPGKLEKA